MYKYKYVTVTFKQGFGKLTIDNHREIIDKYSNDGWRFVTSIPTMLRGYGQIYTLDLVFEKAN